MLAKTPNKTFDETVGRPESVRRPLALAATARVFYCRQSLAGRSARTEDRLQHQLTFEKFTPVPLGKTDKVLLSELKTAAGLAFAEKDPSRSLDVWLHGWGLEVDVTPLRDEHKVVVDFTALARHDRPGGRPKDELPCRRLESHCGVGWPRT